MTTRSTTPISTSRGLPSTPPPEPPTLLARAVRQALAYLRPDEVADDLPMQFRRMAFESLEPRLLLSADLPGIAFPPFEVRQDNVLIDTPSGLSSAERPVIHFTAAAPETSASTFAGQTVYLDVDAGGLVDPPGRPPIAPSDTASTAAHDDATELLRSSTGYAAEAGVALDAVLGIVDIDGAKFLRLVDSSSGAVLGSQSLAADTTFTVRGGDLDDVLSAAVAYAAAEARVVEALRNGEPLTSAYRYKKDVVENIRR